MNALAFASAQQAFAARLARLVELRPSVVSDDIDGWVKQVSAAVTENEDVAPFLVTWIDQDDRRILANMEGHVLENIPSDAMFARPYESDKERTGRYELVAGLMVESGFPIKLLYSDRRWKKWWFQATSDFFMSRGMNDLNEQCISCWARRLLCFFGAISNVRVPGMELRDKFACRNSGKTTQELFHSELAAVQRGTY